MCTGPITYDPALVQIDIANIKAALASANVAEAFIPVAAPITVETDRRNEYYPSQEAYLYAIADALKQEYKAIVDAGFLVQLDDPWVTARWDQLLPNIDLREFLKFCEARIEATNYALADIPRDRIRYHICWGSWHGPHSTDIPIQAIHRYCLRSSRRLSVEAANVRHEHEWTVWQGVKFRGERTHSWCCPHATNLSNTLSWWRTHRAVGETGRAEYVPPAPTVDFSGPFSAKAIHDPVAKLVMAQGAALRPRSYGRKPARAFSYS